MEQVHGLGYCRYKWRNMAASSHPMSPVDPLKLLNIGPLKGQRAQLSKSLTSHVKLFLKIKKKKKATDLLFISMNGSLCE